MNAPSQFDRFERNGKEILRLRPAWRSFWRSGIAIAGILILWLVKKEVFDGLAHSLGIPAQLSALGLAIGLAPIVFAVLYQRYTRSYEVEDGNVIRLTAGFIARVKREFSLTDKIQADMAQTVPARLLNYGSIAFWTGDDRSQLIWANAPDPDKIISYINSLKNPNQQSFRVKMPNEAGTANAATAKTAARPVQAPTLQDANKYMLKDAKRYKMTGFGTDFPQKPVSEILRKRIKTPFGHYIDNGDGTVSHEETCLMWIRAPWGMLWNGESFTGQPTKLPWREATRLFGCGVPVGYEIGGTMAYMGRDKLVASAYLNGYKPGKCNIDFTCHRGHRYYDWRLPTAIELDHMSISMRVFQNEEPKAHGLDADEVNNWRWLGEANRLVIARLFPEFYALTAVQEIFLWSATGLGGAYAWAYDGSFPVGDHEIKSPMGVMFVRQGGKSDYVGYKIENETISAD